MQQYPRQFLATGLVIHMVETPWQQSVGRTEITEATIPLDQWHLTEGRRTGRRAGKKTACSNTALNPQVLQFKLSFYKIITAVEPIEYLKGVLSRGVNICLEPPLGIKIQQ